MPCLLLYTHETHVHLTTSNTIPQLLLQQSVYQVGDTYFKLYYLDAKLDIVKILLSIAGV